MFFEKHIPQTYLEIQSSADILQSGPSVFGLTQSLGAEVNLGSRGYMDICMPILI